MKDKTRKILATTFTVMAFICLAISVWDQWVDKTTEGRADSYWWVLMFPAYILMYAALHVAIPTMSKGKSFRLFKKK